MDVDAITNKHKDELAAIEQYRNHPITKAILEDLDQQKNAALVHILEIPVTGIESFLNREQLLGHLRGLRRVEAIIESKVEEVKQRLEEALGTDRE